MLARPSVAMISITGSGTKYPILDPLWHCILRIEFDDVDPLTFPGANQDLRKITQQQAIAISNFVRNLPSSVSTLVVHCKSGISRSAGVAKAVADRYGIYFPAEYSEYNRHVHAMVLAHL